MDCKRNLIVCRTCLRVVNDNGDFKGLDFKMDTYSASIKEMIQACFAEVDLSVSDNAVICNLCLALLVSTYEFKVKCISTEEKIFEYRQKNKLPIVATINLCDVSVCFEENKSEEEYYLDENNEIQHVQQNDEKPTIKSEAEEGCEAPQNFSSRKCGPQHAGNLLENDLRILLFDNVISEDCIEFALTSEVTAIPMSSENADDSDTVSIISISSDEETDAENSQKKDNVSEYYKDETGERHEVPKSQKSQPTRCFNCIDCGKKFSRRKYYGKHYFSHNGEFPYHCDLCSFSSVYRSQLKRHKNEHSAQNFHVCPLCQRSFPNSFFLCNHLKSHEDPDYRGVAPIANGDQSKVVEMYKDCDKCKGGFLREVDKILHTHWHGMRRYGFVQEGRKTSSQEESDVLKVKIYSCPYCMYSSTLAYELRYHITNLHLSSLK